MLRNRDNKRQGIAYSVKFSRSFNYSPEKKKSMFWKGSVFSKISLVGVFTVLIFAENDLVVEHRGGDDSSAGLLVSEQAGSYF